MNGKYNLLVVDLPENVSSDPIFGVDALEVDFLPREGDGMSLHVPEYDTSIMASVEAVLFEVLQNKEDSATFGPETDVMVVVKFQSIVEGGKEYCDRAEPPPEENTPKK